MSEVPLYPFQGLARSGHYMYRGTSLLRKHPPPQDHGRTLGIFLLKGPRGALFLMSKVHLYTIWWS